MIIYQSGLMQVVSGRVVFVRHRTVTTDHMGIAEGGAVTSTEQKSQYVEIQLDSHDEPFAINTSRTPDFFIGEGDALDIACVWRSSYIDIYGIRNVTDGSIYIARPERVESRSISNMAAAFPAVFVVGFMIWLAIDGERDPGTYIGVTILGALMAAMFYCIFSLRRWGGFSNGIISRP